MSACLAVAASLTACDWDEAERRARCNRSPSTPGCQTPVVDAGTMDAGQHDAGESQPDSGVDAGPSRSVFYPAAGAAVPVGLYPAGGDEVWVVANIDDVPLVERRHGSGDLVERRDAGSGLLASAYADGETSPWLAVLKGNSEGLWLFSRDGAEDFAAVSGNIVSVFESPSEGTKASVWSANGTSYGQVLVAAGTAAQPDTLTSATCVVQAFIDLEVQRPGAADRVALVYDTASCPAQNGAISQGLLSDTTGGVQTITASGDRAGLALTDVRRVGRWDGGFVYMSQPAPDRLKMDYFGWLPDGGTPNVRSIAFDADAGLSAGDVYEELLAVTTTGGLEWQGESFNLERDGTRRLYVANAAHRWVAELGSAVAPEVFLVSTSDTAWVLWAPASGGLRLTALDLVTGLPR